MGEEFRPYFGPDRNTVILLSETLGELWRLLDNRSRWLALLLVTCLAISGAAEMGSVIFLYGYIAALSHQGGALSDFFRIAAGGATGATFAAIAGTILLLILAAKNVIGLLTNFYLLRFAMKRYENIAAKLFEGFLNMRLDIYNLRGNVESQQVLGSIVPVFRTSFNPALEALSDVVILVAMLFIFLFFMHAWPVIIGAALLAISAGAVLALTKRMSIDLGRLRIEAERALSYTMLDGFRGLIDVRLGNRVASIVARYRRVTANFALAERRSRALELTPRALNEMLLATGIVIAGVYFATKNGGLGGALPLLAAMGFAGLRMTAAMARLTNGMQRVREGKVALVRMMKAIRETTPNLLQGEGSRSSIGYLADESPLPSGVSGHLTRHLTLDGVYFTYPNANAPALANVSLRIERGSFIGICGPSGGGKSTLALIIMGLIKPQAGRVCCDGWDIYMHLRAWHTNIGYVGQAAFISPRSVRENVAFGYECEEIDDQQVWRALEMAALADVIRARPEGLDAFLGEEGMLLSGGQRQRVSIARALYRDPDILVFDEATAALDNATEKEISAAILSMSRKKTVICIAHRLSTILDCDLIHYVEGGKILYSGTYDELERNSVEFKRMAAGTSNTL